MTAPPINHVEKARHAWGDDLPDWVLRLAQECARTSQTQVANHLKRSASMISAVLAGKYSGDMAAIEARVRGVYFDTAVECPARGHLPLDQCQDWMARARTFVNVNRERVEMYRACRACPRFKGASNAS